VVFRLQLLPRENRFFDLFEAAGANLVDCAKCLADLLNDFDALPEHARRMRELEHRGDEIIHEVMNLLRQTFIPPLEREDIVALVEGIDDIVDALEEGVARMVMYKVSAPPPTVHGLSRVITTQADVVCATLPNLRHKEAMHDMLPAAVEVNRLENEADHILRQGLEELFAQPTDPFYVIKWREIYEYLEGATDHAEDIGNVLEGIVLRHG
jgi:predicted phosphate transport protein (TIGR00153 family)